MVILIEVVVIGLNVAIFLRPMVVPSNIFAKFPFVPSSLASIVKLLTRCPCSIIPAIQLH
jgi:hypothetical protein